MTASAQLDATLDMLSEARGRGTELISVYVAAGDSLASTRQRIAAERRDAEQIQDKTTRQNVASALS